MRSIMQSVIYRKPDLQPRKLAEVKKYFSINKTIVIKRAIKPLNDIKALCNNHESCLALNIYESHRRSFFLSVSESIWTIV